MSLFRKLTISNMDSLTKEFYRTSLVSQCKGINGVLGHLCTHISYTWPGEPHEDGEMNAMALPSRRRIHCKEVSRGLLYPFYRRIHVFQHD